MPVDHVPLRGRRHRPARRTALPEAGDALLVLLGGKEVGPQGGSSSARAAKAVRTEVVLVGRFVSDRPCGEAVAEGLDHHVDGPAGIVGGLGHQAHADRLLGAQGLPGGKSLDDARSVIRGSTVRPTIAGARPSRTSVKAEGGGRTGDDRVACCEQAEPPRPGVPVDPASDRDRQLEHLAEEGDEPGGPRRSTTLAAPPNPARLRNRRVPDVWARTTARTSGDDAASARPAESPPTNPAERALRLAGESRVRVTTPRIHIGQHELGSWSSIANWHDAHPPQPHREPAPSGGASPVLPGEGNGWSRAPHRVPRAVHRDPRPPPWALAGTTAWPGGGGQGPWLARSREPGSRRLGPILCCRTARARPSSTSSWPSRPSASADSFLSPRRRVPPPPRPPLPAGVAVMLPPIPGLRAGGRELGGSEPVDEVIESTTFALPCRCGRGTWRPLGRTPSWCPTPANRVGGGGSGPSAPGPVSRGAPGDSLAWLPRLHRAVERHRGSRSMWPWPSTPLIIMTSLVARAHIGFQERRGTEAVRRMPVSRWPVGLRGMLRYPPRRRGSDRGARPRSAPPVPASTR